MNNNYTLYKLNAFGVTSTGGNPAGVVLKADHLTHIQKQEIAKQAGLSETAFVSRSEVADFKLEFFTPNAEVNLCGHATIATFSLLGQLGLITNGNFLQETKAGVLNVNYYDGMVMMEQTQAVFDQVLVADEILESLGLNKEDLIPDLPIQIVSTGLRDIIIPVRNLDVLWGIKPDFEKIKKISNDQVVVGYHVFSLQSVKNSTAHCRNFAPLYDIDEEAATGTSNGALAAYLNKYSDFENQSKTLYFEQGYCMNRPSEIVVKLEHINDVTRVFVGGKARLVE
ncbi:MAG: PhzF family phenazine biosynthesis protein [Bacteroidales bacterium]|nr:PhzF family phenazine biosynthesis protein [Bacteroidales bacterium]